MSTFCRPSDYNMQKTAFYIQTTWKKKTSVPKIHQSHHLNHHHHCLHPPPWSFHTLCRQQNSNVTSENSETRELKTCSHSCVYTSNHKVSLNSLYQGQGVNFDRATLPLLDIGAVWVSLQLAFQLMGVKEFKGLWTPANTKDRQLAWD